MTTSLKDNAYHVLGLTGTATTKQILQRANEIVHRLKIDDVATYDLDIPAFNNYRNEDSVKDALRRLQTPKARMREYFFWFRIADDVDKNAAEHLAQRDFDNAIAVWQAASDEHNNVEWGHKRNLALALTISLLDGTYPVGRIEVSLSTWAMLLETPRFWTAFAEEYKQDAELLSDEAISYFRQNAAAALSDLYAEIQEVHGGGDFVYRFQQLFSARGKKIEEKILNPAFQAIRSAIEQLEQVKLGETDSYDSGKASQLKGPVAAIQSQLNKLIDAGLYEDSTTKLLRDHTATALRNVGLDIHNRYDDLDTSSKLLQFANTIAGTDSLKALLKTDLEQIEKNISYDRDSTLSIEIPGTFGGGTIIFKRDHVTYEQRKIYYKNATRVAYHATRRSVNLIPVSQSYSFMVGSADQTIDISWGTTLFIGNGKKQDVWQKLAGIASHAIEPQIVEKLVRHISLGNTINIGGIEFTREGYSRRKPFGGREQVPWTDPIYVPKFAAGNVTVWKNEKGKGVPFATVPMSTPNAVVLPELVKACVNELTNAKR
jgi:hypothetical protein